MVEVNQRQPRVRDHKFLCWLHSKPCCLTGLTPVDAAHIRYGNEFYDKRPTGMGEKPDDKWCLPLVRSKHTEQHSMNEQAFWAKHNIDPLALAQLYYAEFRGEYGNRPLRKPKRVHSIHHKNHTGNWKKKALATNATIKGTNLLDASSHATDVSLQVEERKPKKRRRYLRIDRKSEFQIQRKMKVAANKYKRKVSGEVVLR